MREGLGERTRARTRERAMGKGLGNETRKMHGGERQHFPTFIRGDTGLERARKDIRRTRERNRERIEGRAMGKD